MEILVENKKETLKIFFLKSAAAEMKNTFGGLIYLRQERIPELGIYINGILTN